jgi:putative flippase GtrA
MILLRDARERTRFIKFAVVGAFGFGVDFAVFNLFRNVAGLSLALSSVLSFTAAVLSNFTWNRMWTYPESRAKPIAGQLTQFALVNVLGLAIRTGILLLIHDPLISLYESLPLSFLTPRVLGENTALAVVVIIVMFWNFFVNRYWTYNDID